MRKIRDPIKGERPAGHAAPLSAEPSDEECQIYPLDLKSHTHGRPISWIFHLQLALPALLRYLVTVSREKLSTWLTWGQR